jgi:multiple sugar transport system substrate-binding protein
VLAKGGNVVARTDLASNKYSESDPRVVLINQIAAKGQTPFSVNFNAAFNAPGSPWLTLIRNQIFGDPSTLDADNDAVTKELSQ